MTSRSLLIVFSMLATLAGCAVVPAHTAHYGPPPGRVVVVRPAPTYYAPPPPPVYYYSSPRHRHWH